MPSCPDSAAWRHRLGLAAKQTWQLAFALGVTGRTPPDVIDKRTTRIGVSVLSSMWLIGLYVGGAERVWSRDGNAEVSCRTASPGWRKLATEVRPPVFDELLPWIGEVEADLGLTFDRHHPRIWSDIAGGAKAVRAWLRTPSP